MRRTLTAFLLLCLVAAGARGDVRDADCSPTAVRVDDQRIEILCAEPVVLSERSQDRFREVQRFAYPMVSQSYQPQLGSQGKLLDYYLQIAESAVVHGLRLHVWFDTDHALGQLYGCDPRDCRALVGLAITREPATAAPIEAPPPEEP